MTTHFQPPHSGSLSRLFIFGGAYGNFQATKAILDHAAELGFRPHEILFTGDTVAYCGQPAETVNLIRQSGILAIQGNCEESLAAGATDCGCGFDKNSACSVLSDEWYRFCQSRLDDEAKSWMASLPRSIELNMGGMRFLCTHGTPERINQFVFPSDFEENRYHPPQDDGFDGYITGHSGIPFIAATNTKSWINSGAAGMPANDGTARVWCAIIEATDTTVTAQTVPVEYDHAVAALAMTDAGLVNGYRECLFTGVWPSHDVLPEEEKQRTGQKLKPEQVEFSSLKTAAA